MPQRREQRSLAASTAPINQRREERAKRKKKTTTKQNNKNDTQRQCARCVFSLQSTFSPRSHARFPPSPRASPQLLARGTHRRAAQRYHLPSSPLRSAARPPAVPPTTMPLLRCRSRVGGGGLAWLALLLFVRWFSISLLLPVQAGDYNIGASYPLLSAPEGVPPDSTLFPASVDSSEFCRMTASATPGGEATYPCTPISATRSCLSATEIASAFAARPEVLSSLQPRFHVTIRMQTLAGPAANVQLEMLRILLGEVAGYRVQIVEDGSFAAQLTQCAAEHFDFHSFVWRTNYDPGDWAAAFGAESAKTGCKVAGQTGIYGHNMWLADAAAIDASTHTNWALDVWRAYQNVEAVAGLPPFNYTQLRREMQEVAFSFASFSWEAVPGSTESSDPQTNLWRSNQGDIYFVPPLCQNATAAALGDICGIAYGLDYLFSIGHAQQQIVNLLWRIVLMFPRTTVGDGHQFFYDLVQSRLRSGGQLLYMSAVPAFESATATAFLEPRFARVRKVMLPSLHAACMDSANTAQAGFGIGSMACDFRPEPIYKIMRDDGNSDKIDARRIFSTMLVEATDYDRMTALYYQSNRSVASLACDWIRANPASWSTWFLVQTPLKHTVSLSESSTLLVYVFMGLFLALSVACHTFLACARFHPVVRRASHAFGQICVLGSSLFYIALILHTQQQTPTICVVNQFLLSVGFSLFYGSFLVKTWRIDQIVNASLLRKVHLPDSLMLQYLGAYCLLDVALVLAWSLRSPPMPTVEALTNDGFGFVVVCTSSESNQFRTALYVLRGCALLMGAAFAVRIRDVQDSWNESKFLSALTYNVLIVSAIVTGVSVIGSNHPAVVVGTYAIGVALAVAASVLIFVGTKAAVVTGIGAKFVGPVRHRIRAAPLTAPRGDKAAVAAHAVHPAPNGHAVGDAAVLIGGAPAVMVAGAGAGLTVAVNGLAVGGGDPVGGPGGSPAVLLGLITPGIGGGGGGDGIGGGAYDPAASPVAGALCSFMPDEELEEVDQDALHTVTSSASSPNGVGGAGGAGLNGTAGHLMGNAGAGRGAAFSSSPQSVLTLPPAVGSAPPAIAAPVAVSSSAVPANISVAGLIAPPSLHNTTPPSQLTHRLTNRVSDASSDAARGPGASARDLSVGVVFHYSSGNDAAHVQQQQHLAQYPHDRQHSYPTHDGLQLPGQAPSAYSENLTGPPSSSQSSSSPQQHQSQHRE